MNIEERLGKKGMKSKQKEQKKENDHKIFTKRKGSVDIVKFKRVR